MVDIHTKQAQIKSDLRKIALERRALLTTHQRQAFSQRAAENFPKELLNKDHVFGVYWPIQNEIDCNPLIDILRAHGCAIALPFVQGEGDPLEFRLWSEDDPLISAGFGTYAPRKNALGVSPNVIIIPLVAFDSTGTRLGFGKGFYDRTLDALSESPLVVGFAFSCQELEYIPREDHDYPLDLSVTEAGVLRFSAE